MTNRTIVIFKRRGINEKYFFTVFILAVLISKPELSGQSPSKSNSIYRRVKDLYAQELNLSGPDIIIPVIVSRLIPIGSGDLGPVHVVYLRISSAGNPGVISRFKNWLRGEISFGEFLGIIKNGSVQNQISVKEGPVVTDPVIISNEMFEKMVNGGIQIGIDSDWFWFWRNRHTP
ncbi:MAG TPA: hypothetical protein ENN78_00640 [Candidatus Omnitrophica bacterium]|nr:hypothetical protein [Candidatus Omnitrophota bacterium]